MVVMFAWAWVNPSVWALVVGGITGALVDVIGSHLLPVGYKNRIRWDPAAGARFGLRQMDLRFERVHVPRR